MLLVTIKPYLCLEIYLIFFQFVIFPGSTFLYKAFLDEIDRTKENLSSKERWNLAEVSFIKNPYLSIGIKPKNFTLSINSQLKTSFNKI